MILCFSCSPETKAALDQLVLTGGYRDHSEAISAAVTNLAVIHSEMSAGTSLVLGDTPKTKDLGDLRPRSLGRDKSPQREVPLPLAFRAEPSPQIHGWRGDIPALFALPVAELADLPIARSDDDPFANKKSVQIEDWIFGQFNRLLPVKATCRALLNLSAQPNFRQPLDKASLDIAKEVIGLSQYLTNIDTQRNLQRDDALSVAFPKASTPDSFKSIQRFATQFVGSMNREGQLLGLPGALKLVGKHPEDPGAIALTEAGVLFGRMTNPLLDQRSSGKLEKFTEQEIGFLLNHIRNCVSAEAFAFGAVLKEVAAGHFTPDDLDNALAKLSRDHRKGDDPFVSTQRSGAISRMADLDLIGRNRSANRVSYVATPRGTIFLNAIRGLTHTR